MRLKMIVFLVAAFCLFAIPSFSGDITGKWEAEMAAPKGGPGGGPGGGPSGPMKFMFDLKAAGAKLTGTQTGPMGTPNEILDGKIAGKNISFTIKVSMGPNEMKINYKGTVSGDEIKLTMSMEGGMGGPGGGGGDRPPMVMIAKRQK